MVELRLYGVLWEHLEPQQELDLQGKTLTVADVIDLLGIDTEQVGIVTINGRVQQSDGVVPASCRLCIFQPMLGG